MQSAQIELPPENPFAQGAIAGSPHLFKPHQYLAREGEQQSHFHLIVEGWACRYKLLPDGRRQITGLFLPGDFCELRWVRDPRATQHVVTLTSARTMRFSCRDVRTIATADSGLQDLLWADALDALDGRIEWIVNLGRKNALEKLSHLFCEIFYRLKAAGLTTNTQCAMPLTQIDLADIAGLTPVHVNRTLQDMRQMGLVELRSKWLRIPDLMRLRQAGLFQDRYLHQRQPRSGQATATLQDARH